MQDNFAAQAKKGGGDGSHNRALSIADEIEYRRQNRSVESWDDENFALPHTQPKPEKMRGIRGRLTSIFTKTGGAEQLSKISDVRPMCEGSTRPSALEAPPPFDFAVKGQVEEKLHVLGAPKAVEVLPQISDKQLRDIEDQDGEKRVTYKTGITDVITEGWEAPIFGSVKHGKKYQEQIDEAEALFKLSREAAREQAEAVDQAELLDNELVHPEERPTVVDLPTQPTSIVQPAPVIEVPLPASGPRRQLTTEAVELVHDETVHLRELYDDEEEYVDEPGEAEEVIEHTLKPAQPNPSLDVLRQIKQSAETLGATMARPELAAAGVDSVAIAVEQQPLAEPELEPEPEPTAATPTISNEPVPVGEILFNSPRFSSITPKVTERPLPSSTPVVGEGYNPALILTILGIVAIGLILALAV